MDTAWLVLVGLLGFFSGALYEAVRFRKLLVTKGTEVHRTAEKIGNSFYYIVPETEYVQLVSLRARQEEVK